jgi:hypothetical protein
VSEFIDECRREWKRLRVPEQTADEMAQELAADLEEAKADGVPAGDVLGSGASDPRGFAAAWAVERGVTHPRWPTTMRRSYLVLVVGVAVAVLAAVGAAIAISTSSPDSVTPAATAPAPVTTVASTAVPNLIGLAETEAVRAAQAAGLSVRVSLLKQATSRPGTVLKQTPAGGESVARGSTIVLVVARR